MGKRTGAGTMYNLTEWQDGKKTADTSKTMKIKDEHPFNYLVKISKCYFSELKETESLSLC